MSTQQPNYAAQMPAQFLVTEVTEVSQPLEIESSPPQYKPLSGIREWVRYGWYPTIDIISFIGGIAAIASFLHQGISLVDLGILLFMFNFVGLGGEAGMHRLFAHKSYKVAKPLRILLALAGSMAGEAPILWGGCFRFCVMTLMGDLIVRAGCHLFGTRPFVDQANSQSTNIWFLAIPSLGLSWHNNHHAFPGSALLNIDWWQIDPSGSFITLLEKLGLEYQAANSRTSKSKKGESRNRWLTFLGSDCTILGVSH